MHEWQGNTPAPALQSCSQAEMLAVNQGHLLDTLPSKRDLANIQSGFEAGQTGLRTELESHLLHATDKLRREVNNQTQKTRLQIDDVQGDVRKTEARLEGLLRVGFGSVNYKFNVLAFSNTAVVLAVIAFMYFLIRG